MSEEEIDFGTTAHATEDEKSGSGGGRSSREIERPEPEVVEMLLTALEQKNEDIEYPVHDNTAQGLDASLSDQLKEMFDLPEDMNWASIETLFGVEVEDKYIGTVPRTSYTQYDEEALEDAGYDIEALEAISEDKDRTVAVNHPDWVDVKEVDVDSGTISTETEIEGGIDTTVKRDIQTAINGYYGAAVWDRFGDDAQVKAKVGLGSRHEDEKEQRRRMRFFVSRTDKNRDRVIRAMRDVGELTDSEYEAIQEGELEVEEALAN